MSIVLQDTFEKQYSLDNPIKIGSDTANTIVLLDSSISPFHAEISLKGKGVVVKDLASEGGTFINHKKIKGSKNAGIGDMISIGKVNFFVCEAISHEPANEIRQGESPEAEKEPVVELAAQSYKEPAAKKKPLSLIILIGAILIGLLMIAAGGFIVLNTNPEIQQSFTQITGITLEDVSSGNTPDVLNLNSPALNTVFTTSFIQHMEDAYEGVDTNGNPLKVTIVYEYMQQLEPEWSNYTHYVLKNNSNVQKESEFSILKGQVYSKSGKECKVFADTNRDNHQPVNWPKSSLQKYVLGKVEKVESDIDIKGVITDKYAVTMENMDPSRGIDELVTGELYRAQKGGYLVELKLVQTWPGANWPGTKTYGFSPDQPVKVSQSVDFTYYPSGKLNVIVPGVCVSKVPPAE
ncbi:FHA domain-containing protein [Leptolinea tardivitalis]|uniref:FHA domain-containing protein n=1 Tax=Leptolinea tardivitalis TaxID=229920 RepID=A0A0P6X2A2_9CHLR|nr:FHA domain-containing protein [Leptolinea tardivitalis]KPL73497.1 hypothetical protein ADM99_04800 [Leptolinea tardivitalis]GAP21678.1 protein containing FOG: FHA domain [Leptolinea tardivitalis]